VSLAPLLNAPIAIQLHAFAAMAAFGLGLVQFAGVKGTAWHRARGLVWVGLMLIVAVSSFWIHELRLWGPWSPIHLLVRAHRSAMLGLFLGALVIAGLFTLVPGRIMHAVVFGG
jgi:uncharacterized membrane protein